MLLTSKRTNAQTDTNENKTSLAEVNITQRVINNMLIAFSCQGNTKTCVGAIYGTLPCVFVINYRYITKLIWIVEYIVAYTRNSTNISYVWPWTWRFDLQINLLLTVSYQYCLFGHWKQTLVDIICVLKCFAFFSIANLAMSNLNLVSSLLIDICYN